MHTAGANKTFTHGMIALGSGWHHPPSLAVLWRVKDRQPMLCTTQ